ncbi:hypothetical protein LDENG_00230210 [Lucifuga dentata]|nr:hypothetical protein LDENG_00230210 [Lucifuga dentata]
MDKWWEMNCRPAWLQISIQVRPDFHPRLPVKLAAGLLQFLRPAHPHPSGLYQEQLRGAVKSSNGSPRLACRRNIMEELDIPQMKREVESLQYQLAINREKASITVTELVKWIEGCVCEDPFLNPELMRANPWVEKGKCVIL